MRSLESLCQAWRDSDPGQAPPHICQVLHVTPHQGQYHDSTITVPLQYHDCTITVPVLVPLQSLIYIFIIIYFEALVHFIVYFDAQMRDTYLH